MQNLGDEALLNVFLQELHRALPDYYPVVYSRRPEQIQKDYGILSMKSSGKMRWFIRQLSLFNNELFILGGGGIFHDYGTDSSGIKIWLSLLRRSLLFKRKTALFFVGVDEIRYEKSRKLIADTIKKVDFISVRDKRSADYLKDIGVTKEIHQVIDPAILLVTPKHLKFNNDSHLRVAVCLRHWFKSSMEIENKELFYKILNELTKNLDNLIENHNAKITFYPFRDIHYDDDRIINQRVYNQLKYKESAKLVEVVPSVHKFINDLENIDFLIGMRLHSLILASSKGIPVIALEYMPKVREYMQIIGQEAYIMPMSTFIKDNMKQVITSVIKNYNNINENLINVISKKQLSVQRVMNKMFSLVK